MPNLAFKDYALRHASIALPNGAAAVNSNIFDLGLNAARGQTTDGFEIVVTAPAMGATPMPNAKTMTYKVTHGDASDLSDVADLIPAVLIQTGAGGVGCSAATARVRLPSGCKRYVRVTATGSGVGDATGSSFSVEFVF